MSGSCACFVLLASSNCSVRVTQLEYYYGRSYNRSR
ncbi:hypothetical protein E2C01_005164 [Portunus trituberculatus]|uniref:Uncharacterized protein n=1 Tax=Portunus trituberculatus TaxID=210409 RepID=A0A5B7CRN7_PORTR|nr:hypothetical protein [Portunus trituberculatus]